MLTKMKMLAAVALVGLPLTIASSVSAQTTVLTFEGVGSGAGIGDFYNGGTDSQGHSGNNYGISFSSTALGLIDNQHGGAGNFQNEPSVATILFFEDANSAILNYAAGFDTGFSFYYSSAAPAAVNVFSGLDGTGTLLGSVPIVAQFNTNCPAGATTNFCNWTASGVSFAGTARSISFGGAAGSTGFDNITFGSAVAAGAVPEPATWAMMILGMGAIGFSLRSAKRRSDQKFDAKIKRITDGAFA